MKNSDLISGIFWLFIGLLLSVCATRYPIGNMIRPGPGLLPLVLGIILIFFSLILVGKTWGPFRRTQEVKEVPFYPKPGGWIKVVYTVSILFFSALLFEKIGYLLTVFLLIFFLMLGAEFKSWKRILLVAFFTAAGVYVVFVLLLKQPLPRGFWGI